MTFKIALISDELTYSCLSSEFNVKNITSLNYPFLFKFWRPDFLFVESVWKGYKDTWKFKVASYPDYSERNNSSLAKVVSYARNLGIPTVFWNKEDGVHFDRFIDSAKLFDYIFTVDENCIEKYRAIVPPSVSVEPLLFAVQPQSHSFTGFNFKYHRANFVGSYSTHIHDSRRNWQHLFFESASESGLGLTVVDRNSCRRSRVYRYPTFQDMLVLPSIKHQKTAQIYRDYLVSINVNTIENSGTMFSRRLIEILACGGIAVTNPSPAVDRYFKDYCHVIHSKDEALDLFSRLKFGPTKDDLERARAGAEYVLRNHTWAHRLEEIANVIGLKK